MIDKGLEIFLNKKVKEYNQPFFIEADPICIPHSFSRKQEIEIAGFFAAIFAWGNRTTIINKSKELMGLMDNAPHDFCINHIDNDLKKLLNFKHRTFNPTDVLYFVDFWYPIFNKEGFDKYKDNPKIMVWMDDKDEKKKK